MEFLSYPFIDWYSGPISISTGIFFLFLETLEFSSHPFRRCNSGPFSISIGIMILLIQTLELLSCPSTANIEIEALSFQALEFWPYFYKHCNSHLIVPNTEIWALLLYTLIFLSYPSEPLDFRPVYVSIGILILSFQIWTSGPFLFALKLWSIKQTLEFWLIIYTQWFSDLILQNLGILALFL